MEQEAEREERAEGGRKTQGRRPRWKNVDSARRGEAGRNRSAAADSASSELGEAASDPSGKPGAFVHQLASRPHPSQGPRTGGAGAGRRGLTCLGQ